MTHRITVEVSAPSRDYDTAGLAMWIGHIITEEGGGTIVVHRIEVEQEDT